ncbi:hypothetical protein [Tahibacter harae]|uniref:DUF1579 domain-containing protein n=1 Tax=Tahibacter harae TaxID=2963937 RepID=A0ABT1QTD3_9GAMM|nr:hypothetical protein [Tahibacter harae]MCQ4165543.1 hypothetical protein [Tahibacter harae]
MHHDADRRTLIQFSLLAGLAGLLPPARAGEATAATGTATPQDFDFLVGTWRIAHRKLKDRLVGSQEWLEFEGSCHMHKLLDGLANVDDNLFEVPGVPYRGVTLRAYDAQTRNWRIWWLDSRFPQKIDVPVVGGFADGVGTFLSDDEWKGTPVKVRFRWSHITPTSARWEQAFSTDDGKSWEINWSMRFTRTA